MWENSSLCRYIIGDGDFVPKEIYVISKEIPLDRHEGIINLRLDSLGREAVLKYQSKLFEAIYKSVEKTDLYDLTSEGEG